MRRTLVAILLVAVLAIAAGAESAKSFFNKGKRAEARQDYVVAYEFFKKAYDAHPDDIKYRISYERSRMLASSAHVDAGQKLRDVGKLAEAMQEFEYAAKIDPSNDAAMQEVRKTQSMIDEAQTPAAPPVDPNHSRLSRRILEAAGPVELAPVSNQPITLRIANDTKMIYETIGKLAGINVLFDPDYTSRRIPLELNGVTLEEALDIVSFESKTFWRPITPNTIFVAADTPQKRKDLEQSVLKTFYLSNSTAPTDLQDVQNAIRQVLDVQKVIPIPSQNAIIVRGTPDQIALVEKIIDDLDRAKPEVIVDIAILQVRRDKLRDLGIKPPTSASVALQTPNATTATTSTSTSTNTTSNTNNTTNNTNGITLNTFNNLSANDFAVTLSQASANFLFNDDNSKLIQNPEIRASDNQKATLKIGDRVPIATGSFGAGFGGIGASNLVNTQFQYIDVGVTIDVTPRVHADREITLKMALAVSSVTGTTTIGGISQPIISQRTVEHEIRLKEGEVNLLGGILEQTDTKSVSGLPWLAQLPFLKYLFSENRTERVQNEIVFVVTPHIVRGDDFTDLNTRAIDVGNGSDRPTLRHESRPAGRPSITPATPAPQTAVPIQQPTTGTPQGAQPANQQPQTTQQQTTAPTTSPSTAPGRQTMPPQSQSSAQQPPSATVAQAPSAPTAPGSFSSAAQPQTLNNSQSATAPVNQAAPPVNAQGTTNPSNSATPGASTTGPSAANVPNGGATYLGFDPPSVSQSVGSTFTVSIVVSGAQDLFAAPMQIAFDPKTLQLLNISNGDLLSRDGQAVALIHREDLDTGTIQLNATRPPNSGGISGDGVLYVLTFQAKAAGSSTLNAVRPSFRNSAMQSMPVQPASAVLTVH